jgi:hypothetical protein
MNKNTYKQGKLQYLFYKQGKKYVGICLDLNIYEEGSNFEDVLNIVTKMSREHVEYVIKNKLSEDLLNRPAPKKYWNVYNKTTVGSTKNTLISSPYQFKSNNLIVYA